MYRVLKVVATTYLLSHSLCLILYNIFQRQTSEQNKILQLFCYFSSSKKDWNDYIFSIKYKKIDKMLISQHFIVFLLEAPPGFEPGIRVLQTRALPLGYSAEYTLYWSGKRGSNPRPLPWQGSALSTELFPHMLF